MNRAPFQLGGPSNQGLARMAALLFFLVLVAADIVVAYYAMTDTMNKVNNFSVTKKDYITYIPVVYKDESVPTPANPTETPANVPATQPAIQPTAAAANEKYIVESGDTLFIIATKYGLTVDDLLAANQIPDRDKIEVGQELLIPHVQATPTP